MVNVTPLDPHTREAIADTREFASVDEATAEVTAAAQEFLDLCALFGLPADQPIFEAEENGLKWDMDYDLG